MYCITVKTELKAGMRKRFLDAMLPNAEASARDAPGTFLLYEIRESQDALEDPKQPPHYHASRTVITDLIECQAVPRSDVIAVNPSR